MYVCIYIYICIYIYAHIYTEYYSMNLVKIEPNFGLKFAVFITVDKDTAHCDIPSSTAYDVFSILK